MDGPVNESFSAKNPPGEIEEDLHEENEEAIEAVDEEEDDLPLRTQLALNENFMQ